MAAGTASDVDATDPAQAQLGPTAPQLNLPKGGGAIRGIDEKFAANPVTGTGSLAVAIAVSPGRSGFTPQLTLTYDSGGGNGVFGIGWGLSLMAITRRTDKGIPRYLDCEESDIFVLSSAEDLVPILVPDAAGRWIHDEHQYDGYRIKRYRPRIEGGFARIERWTRLTDGDTHWRSISRNNTFTVYGIDSASRISDPADPKHVFSWLACQSYDDKGNAIIYDYAAENDDGIACNLSNERNRIRSANRYPKRIRYGNRLPLLLAPENPGFRSACLPAWHELDSMPWLFEVVFDYDQGHYREDAADQEQRILAHASPGAVCTWPVRKDPFSSYRSGFEIRTCRLCRRVLMFHHFRDELGVDACLVRSTTFAYREAGSGTFIASIRQAGHKLEEDLRYLTRSWPPLEFSYTVSPLEDGGFDGFQLETVTADSLANLPQGVDGNDYHWLDLDAEGIPGVLSEQDDAWFYQPNNGKGRFGAVEMLKSQPSLGALGGGAQMLMDVAGDGNLDLVDLGSPTAGFHERSADSGWIGFRAFLSLPLRDWSDPNLRFVDLTGDGVADVLVTENDAMTWHPSLLKDGFGPGIRVRLPLDEELGPRVVFSDPAQTIYLADMSGDGLSDILRIRNSQVCYWPNLGYGRFGAKITMDNAPRFDMPDLFEQSRIRLADTDGSGTADIIYLAKDGVRIFLNQAGNSWSDARHLPCFPAIDNLASVAVTDFLGRGTACLLWSSPLLRENRRQLRYIDLMCGQKPHLLASATNHLGAETRIEYASSTEFYLDDKAHCHPWISKLPFPVHVVSRVETYDYVSRNRFVSRYSYHHGFYDGVEREFRGFGRVDRLDTEEFATLSASGHFPQALNLDQSSHVPPVLTKTWTHTGVYANGAAVARHLAHEYYCEGTGKKGEARLSAAQIHAMQLTDTILPENLTPGEAREACRSLKGATLRQEIYALDGKDESDRPYTVIENNYTIRTIQRRHGNRHAVFFTHAREALSFNYERKLYHVDGCKRADPRVSHGVTLAVDDFGNVLQSVAITYGRRFADPSPMLSSADHEQQTQILLTLSENSYTNALQEKTAYRTPLIAETRHYQLLGFHPERRITAITNLLSFDELALQVRRAGDGKHDLPFEDTWAEGAIERHPYRRLLKQNRNFYRSNRLDRLLPLGKLESLALPGNSYALAFSSTLLQKTYVRHDTPQAATVLLPEPAQVLSSRQEDGGGYVDLDGDGRWWVCGNRVYFHPGLEADAALELAQALRHFLLPRRYEDPFGQSGVVDFDIYDMLSIRTIDALGNTVHAENDYRTLQPRLLTDPNGNRSAVAFDALGLVAGSALMGKVTQNLGDSLHQFRSDLTRSEIAQFYADPGGAPAYALLGQASVRIVYDADRFYQSENNASDRHRQEQPAFSATLARETHVSDLTAGQATRIQVGFSYSDGFGREIQKKTQADPGPVAGIETPLDTRWLASGWTIFNNKGKAVRQYEAFFDDSHVFRFGNQAGVSPILIYDAVGRALATVNPDHSWQKIVYDPWRQENWDASDTVLVADPKADPDVGDFFRRLPDASYLPSWYQSSCDGKQGEWRQQAARKSALHAGTPGIACFDSLGRMFLNIAHNRFAREGNPGAPPIKEEFYLSRVRFDIEGNQREVFDARQRLVMRCDYDQLGKRLHQASMDAGERWMLNDVSGKSIRAWDSRGQQFRASYDALRRPDAAFLRQDQGKELMVGRTIYGETRADAVTANLRGKAIQVFDQAGLVSSEEYDFKGNLLRSRRQIACDYKTILDWSAQAGLEPAAYDSYNRYDALNRPIEIGKADRSIIYPRYNRRSQLQEVAARLRGSAATTPFITHIDYDAKGQRSSITYGNGVSTRYEYDAQTFRLVHLHSRRQAAAFPGDCPATPPIGWPGCRIQSLHYSYDAAGNITHIQDDAQQTVYFRNRRVDPSNDYTYDALYRLIEGRGREHLGQIGGPATPYSSDASPQAALLQPGDGNAMARYVEQYDYDAAGNLLDMRHRGAEPAQAGWHRSYAYQESSPLEPGKLNNRLSSTQLGDSTQRYSYGDIAGRHGNITAMPHLPLMQWDYRDQLQMSAQQVVRDGAAGRTWYVYDASGQRIRKVTELCGTAEAGAAPAPWKERLYLDGCEIYREYAGHGEAAAVSLERETLHIMDDKQRIAMVETRSKGDDDSPLQLIRYQFNNHLGSSSIELDPHARIISYEEYSPYGSTTYQALRSRSETPKRYRYTGKERDEENGLYYHGARYCASWLARWLSPDPQGITDGTNLYAYARNNPIAYTDPTGLECDPETQSCVDPEASTAREENVQACLPEEHPAGDSAGSVADAAPVAPPAAEKRFSFVAADGTTHGFDTYEEASAFAETDRAAHDPGAWQNFKDWVNRPDPFASGDRLGVPGLVTVGAAGVVLSGAGTVVTTVLARAAPYARVAAVASTPFLVKSSDDAEGMGQVATIASFGICGPVAPLEGAALEGTVLEGAVVLQDANRAREIGLEFYEVASPKIQATLSAPRLPVTFSTVTREGVTIVNVNNPRVYEAFLQATEEGSVVLRPGEIVGSPPFRSGLVPHPDWRSAYMHAETQGELELGEIFDLHGPGSASSFPNPGCDYCVPWLDSRGIVHVNPKP
jgi:RHS repeat-associated protein